MEAFQAAKPVITTSDSGGVLEIVQDRQTGLVAEPIAEALGRALSAMIDDPARAARLGMAGRQVLQERGLTWQRTIERLLT